MIDYKYDKESRELLRKMEKEKRKKKEHKAEQQRVIKRIAIIWVLLVISFSYLFYTSKTKKWRLHVNGVETDAVIVGVINNSDFSHDQALGVTSVSVYYFSYSFYVNQELFNGFTKISYSDYDNYFKAKAKIGDSIKVIYNKKNPNENTIVERER